MNFLVLTTLPHFISIFPIFPTTNPDLVLYIIIILTSSIFSVLYHSIQEKSIFYKLISLLDYALAFIWFLYDVYLGHIISIETMITFIFYNLISYIIHQRCQTGIRHCIWHLINAYKCFYVSEMIRKSIIYF